MRKYNGITATLGGAELTELVIITNIQRDVGTGISNSTQDIEGDGVDFISTRRLSKKIKIEFTSVLKGAELRRSLGRMLGSKELLPLIFSDEPNIFWNVITDGEVNLKEHHSGNFSSGTVSFLVPSGIAESTYSQVLKQSNSGGTNGAITANSDKSVDVLIKNQGTLPAYPTFKVTHSSDNAYIGFAGTNGTLALGSQDQYLINSVTKETTKVESQWLLNPSKISQKDNFNGVFQDANSVPNPQNGQLKTTGNLIWETDGLRLSDGGQVPTDTYMTQGGMQVWNIPADKVGTKGTTNFTAPFNIWGQATKQGQTGLLQVLFCDANNKLVCGIGVYKDDKKGNTFQTQLYIGGNNPRTWKVFGPKGQELNNGGHGDGKVPNPNLYFNSTTGNFTIQKVGPVFNFTFGNRGGNYPITISELTSTKVTKVYVYEGQLKGRDTGSQYIKNLSLRQLKFQKNDVVKTVDTTTDLTKYVPADDHHYGKSEVVSVNMDSGKIYRFEGETIANDEMITGSEFFSVPPGESIVSLFFGDEAIVPDVEVTWKERFL